MTWGELVTTALLGVTRRPLSDSEESGWAPAAVRNDDAVRLLDLAAAHRTVAALGPDPAELREPPHVAPDQRRPVAPPRAVALLEELMNAPEPTLISVWLTSCVAAHRSVAPVHWTWLARAAARSTLYDRALVGRALGESGRWFLRQNPEWKRLAADATAGALTPPPPPQSPPRRAVDPVPTVAELAADPELIFAQPDPWPVELVAGGWALIGSGTLGVRAHNFAVGVGVRMPTEFYPRIADAAAYYLEAPDVSPALRRNVRHTFLALERTVFARAQIAAAFSDPMREDQASDDPMTDETTTLERVEIPYV